MCRYWAASGACYYGDQCNYLHTSGGTLPPLPSHNLASPSRGMPPSGAGDLLTGTRAQTHARHTRHTRHARRLPHAIHHTHGV